jgi:hypothetical protein
MMFGAPRLLLSALMALSLLWILQPSPVLAFDFFGIQVDQHCTANGRTDATPYSGDCTICHHPVDAGRDRTAGFDAYKNGDFDYFCPIVEVNLPPVLEPVGNQMVSEDGLLSLQVVATDPDGHPITLEASGVPRDASFQDNGDGTGDFVWMPGFDQAGNYEVMFKVTDTGSPPESVSETITITVGNTNRPPVLDPIGDQAGSVGDALTFLLTASDPDGDGLRFGTADLPLGAELIELGNGEAEFSWVPGDGDAGVFPVTFTVTDDGIPMESDSEQIVITVGATNRPPVLDPIGNHMINEGESVKLTVTASDPDQDDLSFTAEGLPPGSSFVDGNDGTAQFSWTPDPGQTGNFTVTCTVTDNGTPPAEASETFTLTVGQVNRPPVLDPLGVMNEGDTIMIMLTASDSDGDDLSFAVDGLPEGAQFTDHGDGTAAFSWLPRPDQYGDFVLMFTVTDSGSPSEKDSRELTLSVDPPPAAPVAADDRYETAHDTALSVPPPGVLANDRDADGDTLTARLLSPPSHGMLDLQADGSFRYVPDAGFSGTDVFGYVADDGMNESNAATVTIAVRPPLPPTDDGLYITNAVWRERRGVLAVKGGGTRWRAGVEILDGATGELLGTARSARDGRFRLRMRLGRGAGPCSVQARIGERLSAVEPVDRAPAHCAGEPLPDGSASANEDTASGGAPSQSADTYDVDDQTEVEADEELEDVDEVEDDDADEEEDEHEEDEEEEEEDEEDD